MDRFAPRQPDPPAHRRLMAEAWRGARFGGSWALVALGAVAAAALPNPLVDARVSADHVMLPTTKCGGYFVADVLLNGVGPFKMLLDTGAPRTLLSPRLARQLRVREPLSLGLGSMRMAYVGNRGLHAVAVGDFRATGRIPIQVRDVGGISKAIGTPLDGVLGYSVFEGLVLTYNFSADRVIVTDTPLNPEDPGVVPMSRGSRPTLIASAEGRTFDLLLDTGFSGELALPDFDTFSFHGTPRRVGTRVRLDGPYPIRAGRLASDLDLGALTFRQPLVRDAVGPGLLGHGAMDGMVVTLDRSRGLARLLHVKNQDLDVRPSAERSGGARTAYSRGSARDRTGAPRVSLCGPWAGSEPVRSDRMVRARQSHPGASLGHAGIEDVLSP